MSRSYFGTDGIRGRANSWPMDAATVLEVGAAAGTKYSRGSHRHRVVVGKDTRLSGYMIEQALTAGVPAPPAWTCLLFGPLPDPGRGDADTLAQGRPRRHDLGVAQSLSRQWHQDLRPGRFKLSDADEAAIEALVEAGEGMALARPDKMGRAKQIEDAQARYIEFASTPSPRSHAFRACGW